MAKLNFNLVARWLFPHFIARLLPLSSGFRKVNFPQHKKKKKGKRKVLRSFTSLLHLSPLLIRGLQPVTLHSAVLSSKPLDSHRLSFQIQNNEHHFSLAGLSNTSNRPPLSSTLSPTDLQLYSCPAGYTMPGKIKCNLLPFILYGPPSNTVWYHSLPSEWFFIHTPISGNKIGWWWSCIQ